MSEHKKHTGQSLFAGIEQLVDQVLFITDIAGQQIRHEHIGKSMFPMKGGHHRLLFDQAKLAVRHCSPRSPTQTPTCLGAFHKKIPVTQYTVLDSITASV